MGPHDDLIQSPASCRVLTVRREVSLRRHRGAPRSEIQLFATVAKRGHDRLAQMSDHEHASRSEPAAAPPAPTGAPLVSAPNAPVMDVLGAMASANAESRDRAVRSLQR